jgi:hypothetical protein
LECRPKGSKPRRVYDASTYRGRGVTPDLAYLDLLGKTADELSILYGFTTGRDVSRSSRVLEELADVLVSRSTLGSPRTSLIILTWLMPSAKEDQVSGKHRSEASQRKKRGTRKRERQGNELTSRDEEVEEKKSILSSKTLLVIRGIMQCYKPSGNNTINSYQKCIFSPIDSLYPLNAVCSIVKGHLIVFIAPRHPRCDSELVAVLPSIAASRA